VASAWIWPARAVEAVVNLVGWLIDIVLSGL
jgi:hypothetical protein